MPFSDLSAVTPTSALAALAWFLLLTTALYFTREPAHRVIASLARVVRHGLRLMSVAVLRAEERLRARNREVLLAAGREAAERIVEREFQRIDAAVQRDLGQCPGLERRLSEEIAKIEADHAESMEVPPAPPGWLEAVKAVANIPFNGDPMVADILAQIRESLVEAQERALGEYRESSKARHQRLSALLPHWRNVQQLLGAIEKHVTALLERAKVIDRHMDEYEHVVHQSDRALRTLSSSSLTQFFIAALVLAIAVGGAVINFHLIARPMAEMVGSSSGLGSFRISDVAALVIIMVEMSMGLFLMESLRITRLFPVIGALPDVLRVRMIWMTLTILFGLASVEAGLAYMREVLLQDELATNALLRGEAASLLTAEFQWITTAAQMGMGFVLPFALIFVAIPLEMFVQSLRTVLGLIGQALLRALALGLRVAGNAAGHLGGLAIAFYDLLIFGPLWLEHRLDHRLGKPGRQSAESDLTSREELVR
jgi:hypothetical protein